MRYVDAKLNSLLTLTDRAMTGIDDKVAELTANITSLEVPGAEQVRSCCVALASTETRRTWRQLCLTHMLVP